MSSCVLHTYSREQTVDVLPNLICKGMEGTTLLFVSVHTRSYRKSAYMRIYSYVCFVRCRLVACNSCLVARHAKYCYSRVCVCTQNIQQLVTKQDEKNIQLIGPFIKLRTYHNNLLPYLDDDRRL